MASSVMHNRLPLSVVTWKWKSPYRYRSKFAGVHVNTAARMVARYYKKPHRFICVTDDPTGIDPGIEVIPLWADHRDLISPHGPESPSCYRRLRMWAKDAGDLFGPRFVSMDLDTVITGDLTPIFERPEELVLWGDTSPGTPYNGGLILMTAGCRPKVWETFDPVHSPLKGRQANFIGSDQAWIGVCLGPTEAKFGTRDGVYSYRNHVARAGGRLPTGARLVSFHGLHDPWGPEPQRLAWVRNAYR